MKKITKKFKYQVQNLIKKRKNSYMKLILDKKNVRNFGES